MTFNAEAHSVKSCLVALGQKAQSTRNRIRNRVAPVIDTMLAPMIISRETLDRLILAMRKAREEDRSELGALVTRALPSLGQSIANNAYNFSVYLAIRILAGAYVATLLENPVEDFLKESEELLRLNPQKVLVVDMFHRDDKYRSFFYYEMQNLYGDLQFNGRVTYLHVENFSELIQRLQQLPQANQFDRIELGTHGSAAEFQILSPQRDEGVEIVDALSFASLNHSQLQIAAAGAEIRLFSCSVMAHKKLSDRDGFQFADAIGSYLLPLGGSIVGSTRDIIIYNIPLPIDLVQEIIGISNMRDIIKTGINLDINLERSYQPVAKRIIPRKD